MYSREGGASVTACRGRATSVTDCAFTTTQPGTHTVLVELTNVVGATNGSAQVEGIYKRTLFFVK